MVRHTSTLTIKLMSGTAERDGIELAPRVAYSFSGFCGKINTWADGGCVLEVTGEADESVAEHRNPSESVAVSHLNLHFALADARKKAVATGGYGPRVLVTGPPSCGRSTVVRSLANWAARQGSSPIVVHADPRDPGWSLPGTVCAAVYLGLADPETEWGGTPTSGPAAVPVKLPLVFYVGDASPEEAGEDVYKTAASRLAGAVSARMTGEGKGRDGTATSGWGGAKESGVLIDAPPIERGGAAGYDVIAHLIEEFSGMHSSSSAPTTVRELGFN